MSTVKKQTRRLSSLVRPAVRSTAPVGRRPLAHDAGALVAMRPVRVLGTEPRSY